MSLSREKDQKEVQQKYEALLGVLKENSKDLLVVVNQLDSVLNKLNEKNEELKKLSKLALVNPDLISGQEEYLQPYINKLQAIQADLIQTNSEIVTVAKTITLLRGKSHDLRDVDIKETINTNLDKLTALNEKYGKYLEDLHTQAIVLGKADLADPEQKKALDAKLTELHKQVSVLKEQVKTKVEQKQEHLDNINQAIKPRSKY